MSRKRGDGLATLSRLKRHELETVAAEIADLNRALGRLEAERRELRDSLHERGDPDAIESTRVLSNFIRNVSETLRGKEAEAQRLQESNAETFVRMSTLFAEAKRIDLVARRRRESELRTRDRAETTARNEAILSIWIEDQDSGR